MPQNVSDCVIWQALPQDVNNDLNDITWDGNQFGVVGSNDTILTSPDGVNWTSHIPGTPNITFVAASQWDSGVPTNPVLGAVGSAGTFVVSPDAVTGFSVPTGTNEQLSGMTWVDDGVTPAYFVMVGNDGPVFIVEIENIQLNILTLGRPFFISKNKGNIMSSVTVKGSCLCGSVKYQVTGESKRFYHCHCKRCRKATGTGHASNLLMTPQSSITWLQGEELLARYKVPDAERFYNCFCQTCGGPMPRVVPELDAVLIPAGSLDTQPPVSPQGRIFWDSREEWSCEDALPVYAEYPPEK